MRHGVARDFVLQKTFLISTVLATSISVFAQASDKTTTPPAENQAPFQLKVTSNLVVVRVVVRDAQNKPVENLQKDDFKLFDRGKRQSITQFAVETPVVAAPGEGHAGAPAQPSVAVTPASAMPQRFLALYFDDLNTSATDLIRARDAADRYLAATLQPLTELASIYFRAKLCRILPVILSKSMTLFSSSMPALCLRLWLRNRIVQSCPTTKPSRLSTTNSTRTSTPGR